MKETKIQWHPGFVAAVDLELSANREDLIYEKEYNLNLKPLEIDLLVIKKNRDVHIENEIGRLFCRYNIMEYKSPQDHLDIDTFYKTQGYACLYKAYGENVDSRKADDITVSIVREAKPVGLFHYFKEHRTHIINSAPGIYYVVDKVLFPTQIIVTRELARENHVWLRALSEKMDRQEMKEFLEQVQNLNVKYEQELADAVLAVSKNANQEMAEELKGDESMKALMELLQPEVDKLVDERVESAIESAGKEARKKEMRTAMKLYQLGDDVEKIAHVMEYSEETVREWLGLSVDVS